MHQIKSPRWDLRQAVVTWLFFFPRKPKTKFFEWNSRAVDAADRGVLRARDAELPVDARPRGRGGSVVAVASRRGNGHQPGVEHDPEQRRRPKESTQLAKLRVRNLSAWQTFRPAAADNLRSHDGQQKFPTFNSFDLHFPLEVETWSLKNLIGSSVCKQSGRLSNSLCLQFHRLSGAHAFSFYAVPIFEAAFAGMNPHGAAVAVGFVQLLAAITSGLLIDTVGRLPLLIVSNVSKFKPRTWNKTLARWLFNISCVC